MEKKPKRRPKDAEPSEHSKGVAPRGASFDTEEGQAAHGMRKDLGGDPESPPEEEKKSDDDRD